MPAALAKDLSSVPSTHTGQLTTVCNSCCSASDLRAPTCTHTHTLNFFKETLKNEKFMSHLLIGDNWGLTTRKISREISWNRRGLVLRLEALIWWLRGGGCARRGDLLGATRPTGRLEVREENLFPKGVKYSWEGIETWSLNLIMKSFVVTMTAVIWGCGDMNVDWTLISSLSVARRWKWQTKYLLKEMYSFSLKREEKDDW